MTQALSQYRYFVAVSPGLEGLLHGELCRLGIRGEVTPGGVECSGSVETLWAIHRFSRLAESVRLRLRPFEARRFDQLEQGLRRLPWHAYLGPHRLVQPSIACSESQLYHTAAVAERLLKVISTTRQSLAPLAPEHPTSRGDAPPSDESQKLFVRIHRNIVQVSVDASGELLHRRGYRTHVGKAPLRETLAAAAIELLATRRPSDSIQRVWDPCCGSATLLSEWLLTRMGEPARTTRAFAFESWPIHDGSSYRAWIERQAPGPPPDRDCRAFGSDNDPRSVAAARQNLARAGVLDHSELLLLDFRAAAKRIPLGTAVVTNLPYGIRLRDRKAAAELFLALDRLLYERNDLRPVVVINALAAPRQPACDWQQGAVFSNGGLRVHAWVLGATPSVALPQDLCSEAGSDGKGRVSD